MPDCDSASRSKLFMMFNAHSMFVFSTYRWVLWWYSKVVCIAANCSCDKWTGHIQVITAVWINAVYQVGHPSQVPI